MDDGMLANEGGWWLRDERAPELRLRGSKSRDLGGSGTGADRESCWGARVAFRGLSNCVRCWQDFAVNLERSRRPPPYPRHALDEVGSSDASVLVALK